MKIFSVVGARPQFVKVAVICRAFDAVESGCRVQHAIIHTGQHYDARMSEVFFHELAIQPPHCNLEVGSGAHGEQTGEIMKRLEPILMKEKPDWLLLYGDTNSTLAGAVVGAKLGIPMAHVEAGLRSFNRRMPEEINRVVADHLSQVLFSPTSAGMSNLAREGLQDRAVLTGDVMYDAFLYSREHAEKRAGEWVRQWKAKEFALATVHRAENTDDPERLAGIVKGLDAIAQTICPVVLPLHPRTQKQLGSLSLKPANVTMTEPLSYLDMLLLESRARLILTDSGGVQKEAYFAQVPCITLREETEWLETLEHHCNTLVGTRPERILEAARNIDNPGPWGNLYGQGDAGKVIVKYLLNPSAGFRRGEERS